MHIYCAALRPPGNVQALVRPLQDHLLTHRGWTSVRAFPPLLPLGYALAAEDLPVAPEGSPELAIGGLEVDQDTIIAPLQAPKALSALHAEVSECLPGDATAIPEGFPRIGAGLFLGVNEGRVAASELQDLPTVAVTRVRQWWYVVLNLEYEEPESWWKALRWREVERIRLPKRSADGGKGQSRAPLG
ncbi:MAG: hypothetical protein ACLFO1_08735 [Spirochaetaceae bacterium]